MKFIPLLAAITAPLLPVIASADEARTALVMGAWDYSGATFKKLPGIDKDVERMAEKLKALGFEVIKAENPNLAEAERAIDQFGATLKAKKGVGLFYFSGHGAELQGGNYLIPVGVDRLEDKTDLKVKAVNAQLVLNRMSAAQSRINLVFLDCCRNEATKAATDTGLAPMSAKGVFVGFATASGSTAAAGSDGSPYTSSLLSYMDQKGLEIKAMHTLVTRDVMLLTKKAGDEQSPFESASLTGSFFFVPGEREKENEGALRAKIEAEMRGKIEAEVKRRVDEFKEKNGVALTSEQMQAMIRAELAKQTATPKREPVEEPQTVEDTPWMFADSGERMLTAAELSSLTKDELWVARNEIYARHGFIFSTAKGRNYAAQLGGYYQAATANAELVESRFNAYEKANVNRIKAYEQR